MKRVLSIGISLTSHNFLHCYTKTSQNPVHSFTPLAASTRCRLRFYSSEPDSQVEKKPDPVIESASVAEAHVKDVALPVEDISDKGLPRVRWVLPAEFIGGRDDYFGGDLFVDGKVLRRPQLNPRVGVSNSSHRVGGRGDDDLWVITFRFSKDQEPSLQEQIDLYVKTLASVVGSEEEAKKRIYAVSSPTSWYTGFRAVISEEMAHELSGLPLVEGFYRDSEVQHRNEDICGGHLLIDGKVVLRPTLSKMQPSKVGLIGGLIDFVQQQILDVIYDRNYLEQTETDCIIETEIVREICAIRYESKVGSNRNRNRNR